MYCCLDVVFYSFLILSNLFVIFMCRPYLICVLWTVNCIFYVCFPQNILFYSLCSSFIILHVLYVCNKLCFTVGVVLITLMQSDTAGKLFSLLD